MAEMAHTAAVPTTKAIQVELPKLDGGLFVDSALGTAINFDTACTLYVSSCREGPKQHNILAIHRGRFMLLDGEAEVISGQPQIDNTRYPKLIHRSYQKDTRLDFLVVVTWLLSIAFGVALWALLFHIMPTIVSLIEKHW
jgi:hypothetical protein